VAAPASTSAAEARPTGDVSTEETIDLGPNWREMKKDLTEGFSGKCLLSFSCSGADPLSGATVSLSYIDVPHQTKITMEYDGVGDTSKTSAKLDIGHYALIFSTDTRTQLDFSGYVNDTLDSIGIGAAKTKSYPPLRITVKRPNTDQYIVIVVIVDQS